MYVLEINLIFKSNSAVADPEKICKKEWRFAMEFWLGGWALAMILTIHTQQDLQELFRWSGAHEMSCNQRRTQDFRKGRARNVKSASTWRLWQ